MIFLISLLDAPVNFFSDPIHFEWTEIKQETLDSDQTSQQSKYLELELMMRPA